MYKCGGFPPCKCLQSASELVKETEVPELAKGISPFWANVVLPTQKLNEENTDTEVCSPTTVASTVRDATHLQDLLRFA